MTDLQVEQWPDRKRKVLSAVDPGCSRILATFVSDDAAAEFLALVNARILDAWQIGVRCGIAAEVTSHPKQSAAE